eukprot:scaffold27014_cov129-Isochrysis_galbana.AAC.1
MALPILRTAKARLVQLAERPYGVGGEAVPEKVKTGEQADGVSKMGEGAKNRAGGRERPLRLWRRGDFGEGEDRGAGGEFRPPPPPPV